MKKVKGFTLIELIVVIAIIAILSAILIPALMGWMSKSRITACNNNAKEVFMQIQLNMSDFSNTDEFPDCEVDYDGSNFNPTATLSAKQTTALKSVNNSLTDMTNVAWAARIRNNAVTCVCLTKNNCIDVGGFPVQCPAVNKYNNMIGTLIIDYLDYAQGTLPWSDLE